jgi:uncharacterized protein (TIGR00369 family)
VTNSLKPFDYPARSDLAGVAIEYSDDGESLRGSFIATPDLIAPIGFVWAYTIIALADLLCAHGTWRRVTSSQGFTTIAFTTNFVGTAAVDELVEAHATPRHLGSRSHVWDVDVRNATRNRAMAAFRCTQLVLSP